mgnify:CR=1 FL=1
MQQNSFFRHMNRLVYMKNWFEKANSSHSLDEVINSASIKLGYSLVFCDKKFRILSYSTSIPVTDKLWKKEILNVDIVHTISLKM